MRVIYTKKECRKDRSARNTIGARYLPKNTVYSNEIVSKRHSLHGLCDGCNDATIKELLEML
jgi:hypothetical protein